jgi:hypothetical protein
MKNPRAFAAIVPMMPSMRDAPKRSQNPAYVTDLGVAAAGTAGVAEYDLHKPAAASWK